MFKGKLNQELKNTENTELRENESEKKIDELKMNKRQNHLSSLSIFVDEIDGITLFAIYPWQEQWGDKDKYRIVFMGWEKNVKKIERSYHCLIEKELKELGEEWFTKKEKEQQEVQIQQVDIWKK